MTDEPYTPPSEPTWHGSGAVKIASNDRHVSAEEVEGALATLKAKPRALIPDADVDFDSA